MRSTACHRATTAALVRSDFLIIGKPGETSLQPGDPNGWLGKTGSARAMNTQYLVTDAGAFEIKADQVESGVNLQLVPTNVPTSTVDLGQVPHNGRLSMFGTNACVLLDHPGSSVQVPGDTYYVPALGPCMFSAPAGGNVTLTPPEGFNASNPQGTDSSMDRDQTLFTSMDPTAEAMNAARWSQPSSNPFGFTTHWPGWRKMEISLIAADNKQPVPKASVVVDGYTGGGLAGGGLRRLTTDENGKCIVPIPSGDMQYLSAMVEAAGYVPMRMSWNVSGGALPEQYTWLLERGTTIGGVVRDDRGRPIAGAEVTIQMQQSRFFSDKPQPYLSGLQIMTDNRGKWQCKSAPANLSQARIGLSHPNFISDHGATRPVKAEELRSQTCELIMKAGITLTGKVVNTKGKPVDQALISWGGYVQPISSDRQGRFRIPSLTPGEITLTVHAAGYGPFLKKVTIEENVRPLEIKLGPGKMLKGRVVDAAGNGIAAAEIRLQSWQGAMFWWYTRTDTLGRFTWDSAPEDDITLSVSAEGYAPQYNWQVKAGDKEQVLTLKGQMQVSGRVVDASTQAAIPSFTVIPGMMQDASSSSVYWLRYASTTGKNGAFRLNLDDRSPRFQVRVEAPGYKPAVSKTLTEDEIGQTLQFAPGGWPGTFRHRAWHRRPAGRRRRGHARHALAAGHDRGRPRPIPDDQRIEHRTGRSLQSCCRRRTRSSWSCCTTVDSPRSLKSSSSRTRPSACRPGAASKGSCEPAASPARTRGFN